MQFLHFFLLTLNLKLLHRNPELQHHTEKVYSAAEILQNPHVLWLESLLNSYPWKGCPPVLGATYYSEPMNLYLILDRLEDREEPIGIEKENMLSLSPIRLDSVFKKKLDHSQNDVLEIFDKFAPGPIQKSEKTTSVASTITNSVNILQLPKFNMVPATMKALVQVPLAPEERRANFSEQSIRPGLLSGCQVSFLVVWHPSLPPVRLQKEHKKSNRTLEARLIKLSSEIKDCQRAG